jgi:hypothetical protein
MWPGKKNVGYNPRSLSTAKNHQAPNHPPRFPLGLSVGSTRGGGLLGVELVEVEAEGKEAKVKD